MQPNEAKPWVKQFCMNGNTPGTPSSQARRSCPANKRTRLRATGTKSSSSLSTTMASPSASSAAPSSQPNAHPHAPAATARAAAARAGPLRTEASGSETLGLATAAAGGLDLAPWGGAGGDASRSGASGSRAASAGARLRSARQGFAAGSGSGFDTVGSSAPALPSLPLPSASGRSKAARRTSALAAFVPCEIEQILLSPLPENQAMRMQVCQQCRTKRCCLHLLNAFLCKLQGLIHCPGLQPLHHCLSGMSTSSSPNPPNPGPWPQGRAPAGTPAPPLHYLS